MTYITHDTDGSPLIAFGNPGIHTDGFGNLTGVYAVCVGPDISDEPIRWLFANEIDADNFAAELGEDFLGNPVAFVTFEPIAYSLRDPDLRNAFPDETTEALKKQEKDE